MISKNSRWNIAALVTIAIVVTILAGCSNPWKRPEVSTMEADKDWADCKRQTMGFTAGTDLTPFLKDIPLADVVVTVLDIGFSKYRENNCMILLGYRNDDHPMQATEATKDEPLVIGGAAQPKYATVVVYTEKSASSKVIEFVSTLDSKNVSMTIISIENDWIKVETPTGKKGWAKLDFVKSKIEQ